MSLGDYNNINWKSAFAQMASERKRFGFLNLSRTNIGSPRRVNIGDPAYRIVK